MKSRGHVADALAQLTPILIENVGSTTATPFSMMQVVASDKTNAVDEAMIGNDVVLRCDLVRDNDTELYISTGPFKIPPGKTGQGYVGSVLPFKVGAGIGTYLQPTVGSLTPTVTTAGPLIVFAIDGQGLVLAKHAGAGGNDNFVQFRVTRVDQYEEYEPPGNLCIERNINRITGDVYGEVTHVSCSMDSVPGTLPNGEIKLIDGSGSFFVDRKVHEIIGKFGFAKYMKPYGPYVGYPDCFWNVTWIDWFRTVQMVEDWIKKADEIIIERKNISVWNDCDLEPETIPLTDCL